MKTYVVDEQTIKNECLNCGSVDSAFDNEENFTHATYVTTSGHLTKMTRTIKKLTTNLNIKWKLSPHPIRTVAMLFVEQIFTFKESTTLLRMNGINNK